MIGTASGSRAKGRSPTWAVRTLKTTLIAAKTRASRKTPRQLAAAGATLQAVRTATTARRVARRTNGLRPSIGGSAAAMPQMSQALGSSHDLASPFMQAPRPARSGAPGDHHAAAGDAGQNADAGEVDRPALPRHCRR